MPDAMVVRDQISQALRRSLRDGEHGLKVIPGLIHRAIAERVWEKRKVEALRDTVAEFPSFVAYIEAAPPEGLGATVKMVKHMLRDEPKILAEFETETTGKPHVHKADADNVSIKPSHGNALAYTLRRIERDRPDLFEKVCAGELSANAAAIEAGFRKQRTPLEIILKLLPKLTPTERRQLQARLDEMREAGRMTALSHARKGNKAVEYKLHAQVADVLGRSCRPHWRWLHITGSVPRGWPDFLLVGPLRCCFLKLPSSNGSVSREQGEVAAFLMHSGCGYGLTQDFDDVLTMLQDWGVIE